MQTAFPQDGEHVSGHFQQNDRLLWVKEKQLPDPNI